MFGGQKFGGEFGYRRRPGGLVVVTLCVVNMAGDGDA